jgi:hypothetical protein
MILKSMNFAKWKRSKLEEKMEDIRIRTIDLIYDKKFRNNIFKFRSKGDEIIILKEDILTGENRKYLIYNIKGIKILWNSEKQKT